VVRHNFLCIGSASGGWIATASTIRGRRKCSSSNAGEKSVAALASPPAGDPMRRLGWARRPHRHPTSASRWWVRCLWSVELSRRLLSAALPVLPRGSDPPGAGEQVRAGAFVGRRAIAVGALTCRVEAALQSPEPLLAVQRPRARRAAPGVPGQKRPAAAVQPPVPTASCDPGKSRGRQRHVRPDPGAGFGRDGTPRNGSGHAYDATAKGAHAADAPAARSPEHPRRAGSPTAVLACPSSTAALDVASRPRPASRADRRGAGGWGQVAEEEPLLSGHLARPGGSTRPQEPARCHLVAAWVLGDRIRPGVREGPRSARRQRRELPDVPPAPSPSESRDRDEVV
jgi:hypothetical protein